MPHLIKFRRHAYVVLAVSLTALLCGRMVAQSPDDPKPPEAKTISLVIDYGDGAQKHYPAVPWRKEFRIGDALDFASKHQHGITYKTRGGGATALLYQIDDLENQGGSGLNWVFRVNGQLGDRSFAITPIKSGDRILWKFDEYR